jgi:hypothetical protein
MYTLSKINSLSELLYIEDIEGEYESYSDDSDYESKVDVILEKHKKNGSMNKELIDLIEGKFNKEEFLTSDSSMSSFSSQLTDYEAPNEYGLKNSFQILPSYYLKSGKKYIDIDFFEVIKDDIRNSRKLNEYQLNYIEKLDEERKFEIIKLFNDCSAALVSLMNDLI